jgi:hypothetical protein
MASSRKSEQPLRGFLIPVLTYAMLLETGSGSTFTEASPRPGISDPDNPLSELGIQASGRQAYDLTCKIAGAGMPEVGGNLQVLYRLSSEDDDAYRGWLPPYVVTGWAPIRFGTQTCSAIACATIPSTQAVVITYVDQTTGQFRAATFRPNYLNEIGGGDTVIATTSASWWSTAVCILPGSERALAMCGDSDGWTLYYNDDPYDAGTWEVAAHDPIVLSATNAARSRMFVNPNGDILLTIMDGGGTPRIYQYASSSLGTTWQLVENWAHSSLNHPEIVMLPSGRVGVVTINNSTQRAQWRSVGSPWEAFSSGTAAYIDASLQVAEVTAYVDADGIVYVIGRNDSRVYVWRSTDEGESWDVYDYAAIETGDTSTYPTNLSACASSGAGVLVHLHAANPGNMDNSVQVTVLGGWSSITYSVNTASITPTKDLTLNGFGGYGARSGTGFTWFPWDRPGDCGWTATGAGTDSLISTGALQISTSANERYFEMTGLGDSDVMHAFFEVLVVSGGQLGSTDIGVRAYVSDGTEGAAVELNCTTTGFRIRDFVSTTALATVSEDMTSAMQFQILMRADFVEVSYRRAGAPEWTLAYQGVLTRDAVVSSGQITWGHRATGTADSWWTMFQASWGFAGRGWESSATSSSNHDRVRGKALTGTPYPLGDVAGGEIVLVAESQATFLRATDGPGFVDEVHELAVVPDFPASAIHCDVEPSPSKGHRTTGTAETIFAYEVDGSNRTSLGSYSHAVAILRANWRTAYWEGSSNGGGAWTTLGTVDLATGFTGLSYTRVGNVVRINGGSAASRYVWANELVGATVDLGGGYLRKIARHTPGLWSAAAGAHVELVLEGVTGSEPASGTLAIWAHSGVLVVHNVSTTYNRFRLRIASQSTADGDLRTGKAIIGRVQVVGAQWDWGSNYERAPNVETQRNRRGTPRKRRLGAPIDRWTLNWSEAGLDLTELRAMTPDWLGDGASATEGLANWMDVPWLLWGMFDELRSTETPVVALADIPAAGGMITDPTLFFYGTFESPVGIENVQGDEGADEVHRVQTLVIAGIP